LALFTFCSSCSTSSDPTENNKEDAMFTLNEEEDQAQDMFVSDDIESVIKRANDQDQRRISPVDNCAYIITIRLIFLYQVIFYIIGTIYILFIMFNFK
jgi:hypothetical protein